ncbi:ParB/RepB/Spo0J family partition protein [Streptomyces zaomyceticus]|uniref:ParB/RepB/Spo0J family partition protein n=1 Tax=Streptomyces zaomyceticus TaxID=68286 RepID=UPI0036C14337
MATKKPWAELLDGPGQPGSKRTGIAEPAKLDVSPTTVYMHTVIGNPDNPRTESDYSDDDAEFRELKESMRGVGQLQPAVAMSSEVFRRVKPEHAAALGDAEWVVILGNRRFHAAKQLGWTKFEIRVRDRLGNEDDDKVDEAVIIENIHRKNIPPYKEAEFLQRMVERHGSQEKVAERIGKSQMYVSNRLALLNLAPELRDVVDTKQIKVKTAEKLSKIKDPEEQKARAAEEILKASQPRRARKEAGAVSASPPAPALASDPDLVPESPRSQNPVLKASAQGALGPVQSVDLPTSNNDVAPQSRVPEPRPSASDEPDAPISQAPGLGAGLPWHDGAALMDLAFQNLEATQRSEFILRYFKISRGVEEVVEDMKGTLGSEARASLANILKEVSEGLLKTP